MKNNNNIVKMIVYSKEGNWNSKKMSFYLKIDRKWLNNYKITISKDNENDNIII